VFIQDPLNPLNPLNIVNIVVNCQCTAAGHYLPCRPISFSLQARIANDAASRAQAAAHVAKASAARAAMAAVAAFSQFGLPLAALGGGAAAAAGRDDSGAVAALPAGNPLADTFPALARMGLLADGGGGGGGGGDGGRRAGAGAAATGASHRTSQPPPQRTASAQGVAAGRGSLVLDVPQVPRDEAVLNHTERVRHSQRICRLQNPSRSQLQAHSCRFCAARRCATPRGWST